MADWIKEMENDSEGDFIAFGDEDERILTIVSEPTKGVSRFQNPDGSEKVEYSFQVLVDDNTERVKSWNVSARQVMQQIVAIMKTNNLTKMFQSLSGFLRPCNGTHELAFFRYKAF